MLWFFNRKEVYIGFSLSDFARVRDTLAATASAITPRWWI